MSAPTKTQRLVAVPEPEDLSSYGGNLPQAIEERESCLSCFGTGIDVVAGKGGAAAGVVRVTRKLNSSRRHAFHVATASARSRITTLSVTTARSSVPSVSHIGFCVSIRR
jgi:hypothetical protein